METKPPLSRDILKDLENIYILALQKGNFSIALKTKELLGRERGLLSLKKPTSKKEKIGLNDFSDDDISRLIEELEAKLKLDHPGCAE